MTKKIIYNLTIKQLETTKMEIHADNVGDAMLQASDIFIQAGIIPLAIQLEPIVDVDISDDEVESIHVHRN